MGEFLFALDVENGQLGRYPFSIQSLSLGYPIFFPDLSFMKKQVLLLIGFCLIQALSFAQTKEAVEAEIRSREQAEVSAILAGDKEALSTIWAPDFMVNNPSNTVLKSREEVFQRMDQGIIRYSAYTRQIEGMVFLDGMVIVMGEETVMPFGVAPMAGKTVKRRYTNVWIETEGKWIIQARHANVFQVE